MDNPLTQLLTRADLAGHVFGFDETRRWPPGERDAILRLGILRAAAEAEYSTCEICSDGEPCDLILDIGPEPRIHCPQHGLVRIARERLQQWEVDFEKLGSLLIRQLGLNGKQQLVTAGRIWQLGRRQVSGRTAEFFLMQGIAWPDSVEVLRASPKLVGSPAPIIVCPNQLPSEAEWRESGRVFFRLSEWARLDEGRLVIEFDAFTDLYRQKAEAFDEPLTPTPPSERNALIKRFCHNHRCTVARVAYWAHVDSADLSRWRNNKHKDGKPLVPDGGERALRIEKLLQRGHKTRTN